MANNHDDTDVPSIVEVSSIAVGSMATEADSFVHVMDIEADTIASTKSSRHYFTPALSLQLTPRHDIIGTDSPTSQTQICATITARDINIEDQDGRAPVDIVVALDISGSMAGDKLALCQKTLKLLLHELSERDRFGLVTFSDDANLVIPMRPLARANKETTLHRIEKIRADGCTNLSGGLGLAMQEIQAIENPNEVRCVFLLTDGYANRGITDAQGIVNLTRGCLDQCSSNNSKDNNIISKARRTLSRMGSKKKVQELPPVTIHTFGYGETHNDELLRNISLSSPGGSYYFVETDDNVVSAFGDALGGILSVVAQNVALTISIPEETFARGVKLIDVHHKSKIVLVEEKSFKVIVGDFYAQETRDLIFVLTLAEGLLNGDDEPVPHASVLMVYTDTVEKTLVRDPPIVASIHRPFGTREMSRVNPHVAWQWLRVRTTMAMENAEEEAKRGNVRDARGIINIQLNDIRKVAAEINDEDNPLASQLISDLNVVLEGLVDYRSYELYGGRTMRIKMACHMNQRSSEASPDVMNMYQQSGRMAMAKRMKHSAFNK